MGGGGGEGWPLLTATSDDSGLLASVLKAVANVWGG